MRILNYGSLNIDQVYHLSHIVRPGETLASGDRAVYAGGKGANQSCALGRAGATVFHAGKIGKDGAWLLERLQRSGVDTRHVATADVPTGHAVIQVDQQGENAIVLFGGANQAITGKEIDRTLSDFGRGDLLLVQNEVNDVPAIIRAAHSRGMKVCFNPAPYATDVASYPLEFVDLLIVNETEGRGLAGLETGDSEAVLQALTDRYPSAAIVLTLGAVGARYRSADFACDVPGVTAEVIDTTAAGDTFIGYLLAGLGEGLAVEAALQLACRAAAITVSRRGAGDAIPHRSELSPNC